MYSKFGLFSKFHKFYLDNFLLKLTTFDEPLEGLLH